MNIVKKNHVKMRCAGVLSVWALGARSRRRSRTGCTSAPMRERVDTRLFPMCIYFGRWASDGGLLRRLRARLAAERIPDERRAHQSLHVGGRGPDLDGNARTLFDGPYDDRDPSVTQLRDRSSGLHLLYLEADLRNLLYGPGTFAVTSADRGVTWDTVPQQISADYYCSSLYMRELADEYQFWDSTGRQRQKRGARWCSARTAARPGVALLIIPTYGLRYEAETDVIELKDGALFAALRGQELTGLVGQPGPGPDLVDRRAVRLSRTLPLSAPCARRYHPDGAPPVLPQACTSVWTRDRPGVPISWSIRSSAPIPAW